MIKQSFEINTLHRGKYMLSFFSLLILGGVLSSQIPASELVKVISILFTIPLILYLSVKWSKNKSIWTLSDKVLTIQFENKIETYEIEDIDNIQSLTRSGGNLYVIHFKKKSPKRFWRNKLFSSDDDNLELHNALTAHSVEYYKM
ncbi:hypothetical protein [Sphingobacterium litopenaei]|uniref:YcxB-like protein domain-containing protein n=1 Tax=Sphingobacterium litopenaei TaxID=2763500 RepID=A0ABR7YGA7_9SPHI|nr:hypothetical protein [Sphingobacterium litopenaei]MBD1430352.1 hypothetical protein [Sphingobacterium litopenaei]